MKCTLLVLVLVGLCMSMVASQDVLSQLMLLRMMGGNSGSSGQSGQATAAAASAGRAGGLARMGGGNPLSMMAMTGRMGDTMRDMMMCNMMPGHLRMMCLMRNM